MKNLSYCHFMVIALFPLLLSAQPANNPDLIKMMSGPNADFSQICNTLDNYYATNPDANEGGGYSHYQAWKEFWKTRIGPINSTYLNSFQYATEALTQIVQSPVCTTAASMPADWNLLGPVTQTGPTTTPNMGIIVCLAVDPTDPDIIYAGSNSGGLWKSTDITQSNITWNNLTDGYNLPGLGITYIAIDPTDHDIIYVSTGQISGKGSGYGIGILKTTDGGSTWAQIGPGNPGPNNVARKIIINPLDPDVIYTIIKDKAYKSINGGTDWEQIWSLPPSTNQNPYDPNGLATNCFDIVMLPSDTAVLFLSSDDAGGAIIKGQCPSCFPSCNCTGNNGALLYRTTNGGGNWTTVNLETGGSMAELIRLAVTPADANSIYAEYITISNINCSPCSNVTYSQTRRIKVLDSSGNTVSTRNASNITLDIYYNALAISPSDATIMYANVGVNIGKSTNGGSSFSGLSYNQHVDVRTILLLSSNTVIVGNDGGVSISTNGGTVWSNINGTGLTITQFDGIGASQTKPNMFSGGTQDNDVYIYDNGWVMPSHCNFPPPPCQDGGDVVIDRNNSNILYAQNWCCGATTMQIYRYTFNGTSWAQSSFNLQPGCPSGCLPGNNIRPMLMNPDNNLYVAYSELYKVSTFNISASSYPNWTKISDFHPNYPNSIPFGDHIDFLDVAPSDPNIIYAGFSGATWSTYNSNDTNRPRKLFKSISGGGLNINDWEDLTDELNLSFDGHWFPEAYSISKVLVHPENPDVVWITFSGFEKNTNLSPPYWGKNRVYMSTNGGQSWNDYSTGLTEFPINAIVYERGSNNGLYVGTDVGIFYTNKNLYQTSGWQCFNDNFPINIVTDLDINYASNTIGAATYGRGIWESTLACPPTGTLTLTGNISQNTFEEIDGPITSEQTFNAGLKNYYRSTDEITLLPNFVATATTGSDFDAFIHNCDQPGNSFKSLHQGDGGNNNQPSSQPHEQKDVLNFTLYPNPTNGTFTLQMETENDLQKDITVFTTLGNEIYHKEKLTAQSTIIDLSSNPKGIYFVKVIQNGKQAVRKIIYM
ncbi:MAG TPA: T9SS type A sorting domain-containing protein [Bacteroidia bacterium]|nr:T9SS type A sorting domain-containing protein [Bacteroidia bacterium]